MNAPTPVLIFIPVPAAGSPKCLRELKPPPYPMKRRDPLRFQPIPKYTPDPAQIEAIKQAGRKMLEATRAQRRAF
jgi:hypothetical protein